MAIFVGFSITYLDCINLQSTKSARLPFAEFQPWFIYTDVKHIKVSVVEVDFEPTAFKTPPSHLEEIVYAK